MLGLCSCLWIKYTGINGVDIPPMRACAKSGCRICGPYFEELDACKLRMS